MFDDFMFMSGFELNGHERNESFMELYLPAYTCSEVKQWCHTLKIYVEG